MGKLVHFFFAALLAAALIGSAAANTERSIAARWEFNVYLGDKRLGKHTFEVIEQEGFRHVRSEAEFRYKFLFIPAYRYEHQNSERWQDDCLLEFEATTNDNGRQLEAFGGLREGAFEVVGEEGTEALPKCVMTFAYWNPTFLKQQRLLNPQSGEFLDVRVEPLPASTLEVRGKEVRARPYRLLADGLELTVWYSTDQRWLGLESVADGGKVLRYELA